MAYETEINELSALGTRKARAFRVDGRKPFIGGMQAGAYVGVAIIIIMTLGANAPESARALVMGGAFGLALVLVVIGGAVFVGLAYCAQTRTAASGDVNFTRESPPDR